MGMVLYAVYQNCDPITAGQVQGVLLIIPPTEVIQIEIRR